MKAPGWFLTLGAALVLTTLMGTLEAADKPLGKLFIKVAPVAEGQFPDPSLEDTVKDMTKRNDSFLLVANESEADFLIIVLERRIEQRSHLGGSTFDYKLVYATLSVRDGDKWKPAAKISNTNSGNFGGGTNWGIAAGKVLGEAKMWVKANPKSASMDSVAKPTPVATKE